MLSEATKQKIAAELEQGTFALQIQRPPWSKLKDLIVYLLVVNRLKKSENCNTLRYCLKMQ